MELKTFKKVFNDILFSMKFSKKGSYYYSFFEELIIIIGLQKSNYGKGYYINIGYVITQLNPSIEYPRDVDGDVRARFTFNKAEKKIDYFDLDDFLESDQDKLRKQVEENIQLYAKQVTSLDELKKLLEEKPTMLYQTKLSAKKLLGFE